MPLPTATHTIEDSGGFRSGNTAAVLSEINGLPGRLIIKRYCHGEIRVSVDMTRCAPGYRSAALAAGRMNHLTARDVEAAKHRIWWRDINSISSENRIDIAGALNCYQLFAEPAKCKAGYGADNRMKIFGVYARLIVQECCHVLERKFGTSGLFITWTVPGKGEIVARTIAQWSGWLVKRIRQWLRDRLKCEHGVIGVWEYQRRGMLHYHLAVMCLDTQALAVVASEYKTFWSSLLKQVITKSGVNVCAASSAWSRLPEGEDSQQDCKPIRKSVGRYLSKYCSKGARGATRAAKWCPSRWVSCDRETHREAKAERQHLVMEGMTIANWKTVLRDVVDSCGEAFNQIRDWSNPYCQALQGFTAWCSDGIELDVIESLMRTIDAYQAMGFSFRQNKNRGTLDYG